MQTARQSLFSRDDTFFGVCEAIGEDFGFHPNLLRVALGVLVLWSPLIVLGTYLGLGVIALVSRWLFPAHRPLAREQQIVTRERIAPEAQNDDVSERVAA